MLEKIIFDLGRTGDPEDAVFARHIAAYLRQRGSDLSPQRRKRPVVFSRGVEVDLGAMDMSPFRLTGKTLEQLAVGGLILMSTDIVRNPNVTKTASLIGSVAVSLDNLFLEETQGISPQEQYERVRKYSGVIRGEIRGVKAQVGEVSDYVELAFLLGPEPLRGRTIFTSTIIGDRGVSVGPFDERGALHVSSYDFDSGVESLAAIPLIVPA